MTDGTSQGLFIVVAIVIFGIFVVMAYILFEETLSPVLANMFVDATENAQNRLVNVIELDFEVQPFEVTSLIRISENVYEMLGDGTFYSGQGMYIPYQVIKPDTQYTLTYDFTILEGDIDRWGGRLELSTDTKFYLYNKYVGSNYSNGQDFDRFENNKKHHVRLDFNTSNYEIEIEHNEHIANIYIQPNRLSPLNKSEGRPFKVKIENLKLVEYAR